MKYDKYTDKECIEFCDKLNSLKGVRTLESCCGHFKKEYWLCMTISNWYSLSLLARAFDNRYSSGKWELRVFSNDASKKKIGVTIFELKTNVVPTNEEEMQKLVDEAIKNIEYWKNPIYEKYLKGEQK